MACTCSAEFKPHLQHSANCAEHPGNRYKTQEEEAAAWEERMAAKRDGAECIAEEMCDVCHLGEVNCTCDVSGPAHDDTCDRCEKAFSTVAVIVGDELCCEKCASGSGEDAHIVPENAGPWADDFLHKFVPTGEPETWDATDWETMQTTIQNIHTRNPALAEAIEDYAWKLLGEDVLGEPTTLVEVQGYNDSVATVVVDKSEFIDDRNNDGTCWCKPEEYNNVHDASCPKHPLNAPRDIAAEAAICTKTCNAEKFKWVHTVSCPAGKLPGAETTAVDGVSSGWGSGGSYSTKKDCKHGRAEDTKKGEPSFTPFELEGGLSIWALAYRDCEYVQSEASDYGVYLYSGWQKGSILTTPGVKAPWESKRTTEGVYLDWPDYGVFEDMDTLVKVVAWMLDTIKQGKVFETACMGGHGRTGTMLACLLVAQGVDPPTAVIKVRKEHCKHAIERDKQVQFVADFYAAYHGNEAWRKSKTLRKQFNRELHSTSSGYSTTKPVSKPTPAASGTTPSLAAAGYPKQVWDKETKTWNIVPVTVVPDTTKGGKP